MTEEPNPYIMDLALTLKVVLLAVLLAALGYVLLKMLIDLRRNHYDS